MGNITINKGLLLDERDLDGLPHAGLESLAERIHDHLVNEFEAEDGWPLLEILGVASERFGATHCFPFEDARPQWIAATGNVRSALLAECQRLGLPDPEALLDMAHTAQGAIETRLRARICEHVMAGEDGAAENLLCALAGLGESGLPGVLDRTSFSDAGDEMLHDFRTADHGPGTRLLAEIAFNWGQ